MRLRPPFFRNRNIRRGGGAFTLMELLVVMAIIAIIMALVLPSVAPLVRSSSMNKATAMITDELALARQLALTDNTDVEVRFYKLPSKSDTGDLQYRAFRSFSGIGANATKTALSPIRYFPEPVIISTGSDSSGNMLSTLLDSTNASRSGLTSGTETLSSGASAPYVSFMFRATGGTSLAPVDPPLGNWYLTIYLGNAQKTSTGLPANYFTAQVDAVTGRVRSYRP